MQPSNCDVDDEVLARFAEALSLTPSGDHVDDDDKYAKLAAKGQSNSQAFDKLGYFFETVPLHLFIFICFALLSGFTFTLIGVSFDVNLTERFCALQLEILGLVLLREKIKSRNSASGISGMTFLMYAMVYFCRIGIALQSGIMPSVFDKDFQLKDLDLDVTLGFCSFLLVLDILKSVFLTYRNTYEEELDVLKMWYLLPVCWSLSLLVRPQFEAWSFEYAYCFASTFYMDVLALMPQVVMMAKSGGKVVTPVANFVAVTSIARCGDLMNSLIFLYETSSSNPLSRQDLTSFWISVATQLVHLVLVADFMYYYVKARAAYTTNDPTPCCCGCCNQLCNQYQSEMLELLEEAEAKVEGMLGHEKSYI
jgi:hypothetical protein